MDLKKRAHTDTQTLARVCVRVCVRLPIRIWRAERDALLTNVNFGLMKTSSFVH